MDTRRVVVILPLVDWDRLIRLAEAQDRFPSQQAAHLIRQALLRGSEPPPLLNLPPSPEVSEYLHLLPCPYCGRTDHPDTPPAAD